jgi:hypothetical protein
MRDDVGSGCGWALGSIARLLGTHEAAGLGGFLVRVILESVTQKANLAA